MGITRINRLENRGTSILRLLNLENQNTLGHGVNVLPGTSLEVDMWVPWPNSTDFPNKHLQIQVAGTTRFWIWQAAGPDGDFLRFSKNGTFTAPGEHVRGAAVAGMLPPPLTEDRTIQVFDGWFEVVDFPALPIFRSVLGHNYMLDPVQPASDPLDIPSVPRHRAVAWSMGGPPSDALDQGQSGARFLYRDTGKRYEFEIQNGTVVATHPNGIRQTLAQAVSYDVLRKGVKYPAPPFDLIAASGGRVFAKEVGKGAFYFATLDESFIHGDDDGGDLAVPSNYFKLDPEFNQPGSLVQDKVAHLVGNYFDHPHAERFPTFRWVMEKNVGDFMVVKVERGVWHRLDCRTPLGLFSPAMLGFDLLARAIEHAPGFAYWHPTATEVTDTIDAIVHGAREQLESEAPLISAPPAGIELRDETKFIGGAGSVVLKGIKFSKVLDIAVGHVHAHQQYERGFGGELQPLSTGTRFGWPLDFVTASWGYRLFNGPLRDGDGFIDGTSNFYLLVELPSQPVRYALLLIDEQTYFSQRWRLADPADTEGLMFALVKDLKDEEGRSEKLYPHWDRAKWWSPFHAGRIAANSRLAVAGQIVLVTGNPPNSGQPLIYSTNFSFSSMDTTWRWRALPATAAESSVATGADEILPPASATTRNVYPETIRLREDLTIHLKGYRDGVQGRYVQRYLPFDHRLVPAIPELVAGEAPSVGFSHPWRFLPEEVFQAADRFSHFGVYADVDSRAQYYEVTPASDADEAALLAGQGDPWLDVDNQLTLRAWKFWWSAPLRVPNFEVNLSDEPLAPHKRPPSIFNRETRLKILRRGNRWLAFHWDKRDDELLPFESGLFGPLTVNLAHGNVNASVTIGANTADDSPPGVETVRFVWPLADTAPITIVLSQPRDVWRVHLAAFDPVPVAGGNATVVSLLDVEFAGNFVRAGSEHRYTFLPTSEQRNLLRRLCTATGAAAHGTSLWVEDILGRVAVPDAMRFETPMSASASPSLLPLGVSTTVTIHAQDSFDGSAIRGQLMVDDVAAGATDVAIERRFDSHFVTEWDPESHTSTTIEVMPELSVVADDHSETGVPVQFYKPTLSVSVEPTTIRLFQATAVTVRCSDSRTGAPVAGRVIVGGIDVGSTNAPFVTTFTAMGTSGGAVAPGFPVKTVAFPLVRATFQTTVEPNGIPKNRTSSVVVRAVDSISGAPVAARVWLDGVDVAAANAPFSYAFGSNPPSGVVKSSGYNDGSISWPPFYSPRMVLSIQPFPTPVGMPTTFTVTAREAFNNQPIDGEVRVNGVPVGRTNLPFVQTLKMRKERVYDADLLKWITLYYPPDVTVAAAGYPLGSVPLGLPIPE